MSLGNDSAPTLVVWIQQQWKELLGAEAVGPDDSFFEFGGDSLAALQIVARLRQQGIDIELMDVFENSTVSEFAEFLCTVSGGAFAATPESEASRSDLDDVGATSHLSLPRSAVSPEHRFEPFPLTDMQEAYWMGRSGLLEFGSVSGHNYREYECTSDVGRVESAWQRLIERHDMLRAIIRPDGQQQVLREVPAYHIEHVDLRGRSVKEVQAILSSCREQMTSRTKPPEHWPPFEIRAFTLGDGRLRVHMRFEFMIYDAHTQRMLLREWARLCEEPDSPLPPLEFTFRDYVMELERLKEHETYTRARDYWLDRVPELPPKPDIPMRHTSVEQPDIRGLRGSMQLARWLRLSSMAATSGLTLSTVMCTAFADALAAWSRDERFLITVMLLDRLPVHDEVNSIVGNFSSTVLLEIGQSRGKTFIDRARAIQEQLSKDLDHRYFPGGQVLREINRLRSAPLAAASPFVFVSTLGVDRKFQGGSFWKYIHGSLTTPQILVDMRVVENNGIPAFRCEYVEQCFPDNLLPELFDAYLELVARLADDPQVWSDERRRIIPAKHLEQRRASNATSAEVPDHLLHTMFLDQVESRATHPAVVTSERTLSYEELHRMVIPLSRQLVDLGARRNELVAIVMEKGWEQIVAALAILHAGAAYVPINPALPRERRERLLQRCETRIVLTQPWLAERLPWPDAVPHRVVVTAESTGDAFDSARTSRHSQDDLAYVIFTSGSTGVPKGVMMTHTGAVNTLVDINRRFKMGPDDRVLAVSALDFDLSVYDIFGLLGCGGALVVPDHERSKDPLHWAEVLEREQVTVWNSVPALLELLVDYVTSASIRLPDSLRLILLSGDWIPVSLPDRVRALLPDVEIISLGGATEAAVWSIYYPIEAVHPTWNSIPYGKPLTNQRFYVLDSRMEDRPLWATGELYISGLGLAKGYWRDPDKTRERFIQHPHTGERLYWTGDLGRYLPDGNIEFLGRADSQVKVQGYRIELGEIEAVLTEHPEVHVTCATIRDADDGAAARARTRAAQSRAPGSTHKRLFAYVKLTSGARCDEEELREYLRRKLPEYMIPHRILIIDELPLSSNGKVDHRALPDPTPTAAPGATGFVAPRNRVERELARIWSQLLDVRRIGVTQDFFDLGGDSVLAVRLFAAISRTFGRALPVSTLFAHPTIESMAPILATKGPAAERRSLVTLGPDGQMPPLFCVHPVGGSALCYMELARGIGHRPVYGLQSRGLDGDETPLASVEEMAAAYIGEVRQIQRHGSYVLAGWSMGGVIAFEMARQLQSMGEEIAALVLIDAPAQSYANDVSVTRLLQWFGHDLLGSRGVAVSERELSELPSIEAGLAHIVSTAKHAGLDIDIGLDRLARLFDVFCANARALAEYQRKTYSGPVWLIGARDSETNSAGWRDLVSGPVHVITIAGDHYTIFQQPNLSILIGELNVIMATASGAIPVSNPAPPHPISDRVYRNEWREEYEF